MVAEAASEIESVVQKDGRLRIDLQDQNLDRAMGLTRSRHYPRNLIVAVLLWVELMATGLELRGLGYSIDFQLQFDSCLRGRERPYAPRYSACVMLKLRLDLHVLDQIHLDLRC